MQPSCLRKFCFRGTEPRAYWWWGTVASAACLKARGSGSLEEAAGNPSFTEKLNSECVIVRVRSLVVRQVWGNTEDMYPLRSELRPVPHPLYLISILSSIPSPSKPVVISSLSGLNPFSPLGGAPDPRPCPLVDCWLRTKNRTKLRGDA